MKFIASLFLALSCLLPTAQAASVLPLYLDEMIDTATTAFEGTCTGNRTERDPATNLVVTYTTFEVRDVLKGTAGATHVIKQVGGTLPDEGVQYRISGVPTFEVGRDYIVFLAGVSKAGFSSPIGLAQGKFTIESGAKGRRLGNGRDFKDMASRALAHMPANARAALQQAQEPVRDMDVADFKQTVRNRVGAGQ